MSDSLIEPLEGRVLFSRPVVEIPDHISTNRHVQLARQLVAEVTPENNLYATPTQITWRGIGGATVSTNTSVCSTLVTKLLKQAYGFTNTDFITWTGESSPEAEDYYAAAANNNGFTRIMNIADLRVGDLFIARYLEQTTSATGHIAMIAASPRLISTTGGERQYYVEVIDSSSSYHGPSDTRHRIDPTTGDYDDGVGQGTMRMITDANGLLIKYSWSTLSSSIIYDASQRPSLLAKIPPHGGAIVDELPVLSQRDMRDSDAGNPFHSGANVIRQSAIDLIGLA